MVDVNIYRRIYLDDKFSLGLSSYSNNRHIAMIIQNAIKDINEIMRSKVVALNGNCILGYRLQIIKLKEEYFYNRQAIFLAITAIGDAVEIEVIKKPCAKEDII